MRPFLLILTFLSLACGVCAAVEPADDLLKPKPEAIEAWKDMRFGMFICWGPVSLTGKEIGWLRGNPTPIEEYDTLYKHWNPDQFDAHEWAKVVKDSGARYIVFLLKHHDGFCLWDTRETDHNVMNGPFKRDVAKEIAAACREADIGFFPYYSTCDWHHPDFPLTGPGGSVKRPAANLERYTQYLEAQVRELITGYGPLVGVWFDVPQEFDRARGERVIRFVRGFQPDILVNNRTGAPGDFDTPENSVGHFQIDRPWETNATLNHQWAWKPDDTIRPLEECLQMLVVCACGDGNFVLNTGPMPDGRIEPQQVVRFGEIGDWLRTHGESIYGTRGGPFRSPDDRKRSQAGYYGQFTLAGGRYWGGSTHKGNTVYLHILRWPSDTIGLPAVPRKVVKAGLLGGGDVTFRQTDDAIEVSVPAERRDPIDTIVKLELDGPAADIRPIRPENRSGSLAFGKKATASNVFQNQAEFSPEKAFDDDPDTRWGCDWGTKSAWLEVDLGSPQTFSHAWISEPYDRVQEFELEVWKDGEWTTFHRGTTIGSSCAIDFAPVTGQRVRLNLLRTTEGPSIWEFQLEGGNER